MFACSTEANPPTPSGEEDEYFPIHSNELMKQKDYGYGMFFNCANEDCPVAFGEENTGEILRLNKEEMHPKMEDAIVNGELKCECDYTPKMGLSLSEKNPGRVYLECPSKNHPCKFFSWLHFKPRKQRRERSHSPPTPLIVRNYNESFHKASE